MDERSTRQRAIDEAAEIIRMCYPKMTGPMFVASQDWFARYQHLLTAGQTSATLTKQFGAGDPNG